MRHAVTAVVLAGSVLCAPQLSAKKMSVETVYEEALECRLAAQSILQSLQRVEAPSADEAEVLQTVENTESFYQKLSLLLGRKLGKREPIIGMDFARLQLELAQALLTTPNAMADMLKTTKTCGEAISEAEKAQ